MSIKTAISDGQRDKRSLALKSSDHVFRHRAIGAALTAARQHAGISQRELSARLSRAHSFVAKIEGGSQHLKVLELLDYAHALDTDAAGLFSQIAVLANASEGADELDPNQTSSSDHL